MNQDLIDLVLVNLSFYEPMNVEKIILDMDTEELMKYPSFDRDTLDQILTHLKKRGLVKRIKKDKDIFWLRLMKKRPWWKRYFN